MLASLITLFPPTHVAFIIVVYSLFAKSELSVLQESASTLSPPFSIIMHDDTIIAIAWFQTVKV